LFTRAFIGRMSAFSDKCVLNATQNGEIVLPADPQQCIPLTPYLFPIICRFKELSLGMLLIRSYDLIDLLTMRLGMTVEGDVYWEFCISRELENVDIDKINTSKASV
ncbi:hypothetical protein PMAYCL1PPCAC_14187, partial [Pristionchus mayeri]